MEELRQGRMLHLGVKGVDDDDDDDDETLLLSLVKGVRRDDVSFFSSPNKKAEVLSGACEFCRSDIVRSGVQRK